MDTQILPIGHANFTAINNTNYNNIYINNPNLQQQQEKTPVVEQKKLSFIKESLSDFEIRAILKAANYDVALIKEKYQIIENKDIQNVVGFLIAAIKRDFRLPQKRKKQNPFVNFEQRTDWDFEELERLERERIRQDIANLDKKL